MSTIQLSPDPFSLTLDEALRTRVGIEQVETDIGIIQTALTANEAVTPYWFNTADPTALRPPGVEPGVRVMWPVARAPSLDETAGVWTPTLSGPPLHAELVDTYDPPADRFDITLAANGTLASLLRAGGGALDAVDVDRTGVIVVTQDATGGRTLTPAGGSHYTLFNDALDGGALPIDPAADATTLIYFHILSATSVGLFIAKVA